VHDVDLPKLYQYLLNEKCEVILTICTAFGETDIFDLSLSETNLSMVRSRKETSIHT